MSLLDRLGQGLQRVGAAIRRAMTAEYVPRYGRGGWDGSDVTPYTPSELKSIFTEADRGDIGNCQRLFEVMDGRDGDLFALAQSRAAEVISCGWGVTTDDDSDAAKLIAGEVDAALQDLNFEEALWWLLTAVPRGFACVEIAWEIQRGRLLPTKFAWVPGWNFRVENDREFRLLTKDSDWKGRALAPHKQILHVAWTRTTLPARLGLYRPAAWPWLLRTYALPKWASYVERYGEPFRWGKYPRGASTEEKAELKAALDQMGANQWALFSEGFDLEMKEAERIGSVEMFDKLLTRCLESYAKIMQGETLTSGQGMQTPGSYALGKVHQQTYYSLVDADARALTASINQQLIRPFVELNWGAAAPVPRFQFNLEIPDDLQAKSAVWIPFLDRGLAVSEQAVRETFQMPQPQEGETIWTPKSLATPGLPADFWPLPGLSASLPAGSKKNFAGGPLAADSIPPALFPRWAPGRKPRFQSALNGLQFGVKSRGESSAKRD